MSSVTETIDTYDNGEFRYYGPREFHKDTDEFIEKHLAWMFGLRATFTSSNPTTNAECHCVTWM